MGKHQQHVAARRQTGEARIAGAGVRGSDLLQAEDGVRTRKNVLIRRGAIALQQHEAIVSLLCFQVEWNRNQARRNCVALLVGRAQRLEGIEVDLGIAGIDSDVDAAEAV